MNDKYHGIVSREAVLRDTTPLMTEDERQELDKSTAQAQAEQARADAKDLRNRVRLQKAMQVMTRARDKRHRPTRVAKDMFAQVRRLRLTRTKRIKKKKVPQPA